VLADLASKYVPLGNKLGFVYRSEDDEQPQNPRQSQGKNGVTHDLPDRRSDLDNEEGPSVPNDCN